MQVIGKLVQCSGFEDVVFQAGLCTSGSLNGVLSGSHYNRGWTIHNAFSEALERKLLQRYLYDQRLESPYIEYDQWTDDNILEYQQFIANYEKYRDEVRTGKKGMTAQFWMIYIDLMQAQTMAHLAVQENDLDMLIAAWNCFLPMYFVFNKFNYARYGSLYFFTLVHMEKLYPCLRQFLVKCGISVQAQESFPSRTSIDQRGEQTINRDAKTSGK